MAKPRHNARAAVVALVLATLALTQVIAIGFAQEKLPPPTGHINDAAGVLEAANKKRLETILENLKGRTELDLVVAIIKSAGNEDLYDYSLRLAGEWNVGPRAARGKSLLLLITADNGRFFAQFSRTAQAELPDGLIGEMGRRMQPKFEKGDYNAGLLSGIQTFVTAVGEQQKFTFAELDTEVGETQIAQTRPRTVESLASPLQTATPEALVTPPVEAAPTTTPEVSPSPTPVQMPTPATETPTATPSVTPSPTATGTETPSPSPIETPQTSATESPRTSPTETPQASPIESPAQPTSIPDASPIATPTADATEIAKNPSTRNVRPTRSPVVRANAEDEKAQG